MTLWILVEFKMHRSFIVNIVNPFSYINFKIALEEIFLKNLHFKNKSQARCLKILEKVSFNIASEASYVYIFTSFSLKMPKLVNLGNF